MCIKCVYFVKNDIIRQKIVMIRCIEKKYQVFLIEIIVKKIEK